MSVQWRMIVTKIQSVWILKAVIIVNATRYLLKTETYARIMMSVKMGKTNATNMPLVRVRNHT